MRQSVQTNLIFLLAGVILIVIGACVLIFWPSIFKIFLTKELVISEKSKSFSEWKKPSVEVYFDVYLFNWTNAEEFVFPEFPKPIFKELGPYRFREIRDKVNIRFNDQNSTVSYKPISTFFFDQTSSKGSLDDVISNINMVALGAASQSLKVDYQKRKVISMSLNGYYEQTTITKTARELLFEGYEDDMVSMGRLSPIEGFDISHIPYDKVGWFYMRNASAELSGVHNIHTGKSDSSKLGLIQNYNGGDFKSLYKGHCSKVYGSTGELFPPDEKYNKIEIFTPDMCRTLTFDFEREVEVNGVKGYRYTAGERLIDNGTKHPENLCYSEGKMENTPSGVFNISACRYSSPVFISYPHFYMADRFYFNQIEGMQPDQLKHESYVTIEPTTGVPLEVAIRFQANFFLKEYEDIALFQSVPDLFIPAMWVEQKYKINETMSDEIKIALQIPNYGRIIGLTMLLLGLVFVLISVVIRCLSHKEFKDHDDNLPEMKQANRKPNESSPPLLNSGNKKPTIKIQKMDQLSN